MTSSEKKYRKIVSSCKTPVMDSKKSVSLMPPKMKSNKITFSDLETPKEIEKCPQLSSKLKQASGFSDLYTIAEEKASKAPLKLVPQISLEISDNKCDTISKKIHRSVRKNKVSVSLMSTQKFSSDIGNDTLKQKEVSKFPSDLKMKEINTDAAKTDLDHQFISLTVEAKLPPKHLLTTKKDRIVRNKLNDQPARDGKSQQKSARRDRKERMRSAHSQNRVTSTQNIPTKNTYVTKESKSKAVPKIFGNNKDSFQEAENDTGKDRIKEMLRKIDSLEESSINLHKTEISEKYMLPHAKKYQVFKKSERLNYGPLLSKNPASGKNSFIENNKMKLQVTRDAQDPSRKKKETLNHIVSQESLNSNYFQRSGFSGQNTTASDKNSEQEKNQTKKEESK